MCSQKRCVFLLSIFLPFPTYVSHIIDIQYIFIKIHFCRIWFQIPILKEHIFWNTSCLDPSNQLKFQISIYWKGIYKWIYHNRLGIIILYNLSLHRYVLYWSFFILSTYSITIILNINSAQFMCNWFNTLILLILCVYFVFILKENCKSISFHFSLSNDSDKIF